MRKITKALTLGAALLLAACGGGTSDGATPSPIAQLQACLGLGVNDFLGALGAFQPLLGVAANPGSAAALGITWTEISDTEYDFSIPADLDGDGTPDGQFVGRASFSADPEGGGLTLGDSVQLTWMLQGNPDLDGSADITVTLTPTHLGVHGTIGFDSQDGCSFTIFADQLSPLELRIDGVWPPTPAFAVPDTSIHIAGSALIEILIGDDSLMATADFSDTAPEVLISNASAFVAGTQTAPPSFAINLGPATVGCGSATVDDWVGTWDVDYDCQSPGFNSSGSEVFVITKLSATRLQIDGNDTTFNEQFVFFIDLNANDASRGTYTFIDTEAEIEDRGEYWLTCEIVGTNVIFRINKTGEFGPVGFTQREGTCTGDGSKR